MLHLVASNLELYFFLILLLYRAMNIFSIHCNERFRFPIVIKRCKRSLFEARDSCNVS
jgi:hypothetical protein